MSDYLTEIHFDTNADVASALECYAENQEIIRALTTGEIEPPPWLSREEALAAIHADLAAVRAQIAAAP